MLIRARNTRRQLLLAALVAALVALPWLANPYQTSLLVVIGIHTIIAVGLCLLMGYAGQASLGQAAFYGLGAFTSGILSATYGVSPWLGLLAGAAGCGLLAYATGRPILSLRGNYLAMATLAFGIIVYIILVEAKDFTGGPSGLPGIPSLTLGGFEFDSDRKYYYLVWAVCLGVLFLSQNIVNSRPGRALRAIHASEAAARSLGVDVASFKVLVFTLSAVYAGLAGGLYAHYTTFVSPQPFGFIFSIRLVTMVVIGGLASIWGAIFGTASLTVLSELLHPFGDLDVIVFGLIMMLVMIFMPQGLTRGLLDLYERRLARR
ncbi:MAG: branched-chain amino acid ABC transporter permease [Chloroflexi bacterium]|nr:branched-chain amino acid ABC transporter permease [Chloroflexota bacterium]